MAALSERRLPCDCPQAALGHYRARLWALALASSLILSAPLGFSAELYSKRTDWVETMLRTRQAFSETVLEAARRDETARVCWFRLKEDFPVQWDWAIQDGDPEFRQWFTAFGGSAFPTNSVLKVLQGLAESGAGLRQQFESVIQRNPAQRDRALLEIYVEASKLRREERLRTVRALAPKIVFTRHRTVRPSFFAYTEGQSDAQSERHFLPGSELCLWDAASGQTTTLVADPGGAIRDPAVSWDGQRVLFAWKKSLDEDDYHIYELSIASNQVRQITLGLGFADYEPAFLPSGDIIFASTRCVQTVDCWWTEVSNLYTCDPDGRFLRRLGFDQVHTVYPQVLDDGRVIYTRWDYSDRGQIFPQGLFQMFPDGTGQTEFYGNNSWFPTTIAHARGIPGTEKALAVLCGHHTSQAGKLAIIDPAKGRQENSGVQLIAPVRETPAERIDGYGQDGELFQYPYPLNDREFLVTYAPLGWEQPERCAGDADFGIYWMDLAGHRELLAWNSKLPSSQPVPLVPRTRPLLRANRVDYTLTTGTYYLQDIYAGPGLQGVARGTIKKLRVVGLEFRPAGIGENGSTGPAGGALVCTPVSIGNGSWDVKVVLGDAKVYEDGSAMFSVPARTPVYFQPLDEKGRAVQTMRSWSTLQPGEFLGCVGCHENKNTAPPGESYGFSLAMKAGVQNLEPFYGPPRGFSFSKEIQPILDRYCTRCHKDREPVEELAKTGLLPKSSHPGRSSSEGTGDELAFSLLSHQTTDVLAKRRWSDAYLMLTQAHPVRPGDPPEGFAGDCGGRIVNWLSSQSVPEPIPPYSAGSARSELLSLLEKGHYATKLSREEMEKLACWIDLLVPYCGDYLEANAWSQDELKKYERYLAKRRQMEEFEQDNVRDLANGRAPARRPPFMRGLMRPG